MIKNIIFVSIFILYSCNATENNHIFKLQIKSPYSEIDFENVLMIPSQSHEHITTQSRLEKAWNRGIRIFAVVNYQPSVPTFPLSGGVVWKYEDFESYYNTKTKIIRTHSVSFSDFIDKNGNIIHLDSIPQIYNCEKVNADYGHSNFLGASWGDAGWVNPIDAPSDINVTKWRSQHKQYSYKEIFANINSSPKQFGNKIFGTSNHNENLSLSLNFIKLSNGLIKGMEIWNQTSGANRSEQMRKTYDNILMEGYKIWGVAVVDWQGNGSYVKDIDRGCNVMLLPNSYNNKSRDEKAELALDAYIDGRFFCSGWNTFQIKNVEINETNICIQFTQNIEKINIIMNGKSTSIFNSDSAEVTVDQSTKFVRFEAWNNDDFLFTQPFFVEKIQ